MNMPVSRSGLAIWELYREVEVLLMLDYETQGCYEEPSLNS